MWRPPVWKYLYYTRHAAVAVAAGGADPIRNAVHDERDEQCMHGEVSSVVAHLLQVLLDLGM